MPKIQRGQAHVLSPDEMNRVYSIIGTRTHSLRDKLIFIFSYGLGLRAVELAALKLNQIFREDVTINEVIILTRTKGNKQRTVYIPSKKEDKKLHALLEEYIVSRKKEAEEKRKPFSLSHPMFLSQKGFHFTNKTMQKRFEVIYKLAGIYGASSHSGRRSFATRLNESGYDLKSISTLMGHSSTAMTAKYIDSNPERLKRIARSSFKSTLKNFYGKN